MTLFCNRPGYNSSKVALASVQSNRSLISICPIKSMSHLHLSNEIKVSLAPFSFQMISTTSSWQMLRMNFIAGDKIKFWMSNALDCNRTTVATLSVFLGGRKLPSYSVLALECVTNIVFDIHRRLTFTAFIQDLAAGILGVSHANEP